MPPEATSGLKLISLNVHGLKDCVREINRIAHEEQPHFICLQETFIKCESEVDDLKHRLNYTEIVNTFRTRDAMGEMIICYGGEWEIINIKKGNRFLNIKISNGVEKYNIIAS